MDRDKAIDELLNIMGVLYRKGKVTQFEPHVQLQGLGVTREESQEIVNFLVEKKIIEGLKKHEGSFTITEYGMRIYKDGGYIADLKIQEDLSDIRNVLNIK